MSFKFLPHTADIKIEATGKDLSELFSSSGEALFSAMMDLKRVEPAIERKIELSASDMPTLLHDWLEELLFIFDTEFLVFSRFKVQLKGNTLSAIAYGETLDQAKHQPSTGVKAITYNEFEVRETEKGYKATIVIDV